MDRGDFIDTGNAAVAIRRAPSFESLTEEFFQACLPSGTSSEVRNECGVQRRGIAYLKAVAHSAFATQEAEGRRPSVKTGDVEYGRLAGTTTWSAINQSFYSGTNGLTACRYTSMIDFFDACGIVNAPAEPRTSFALSNDLSLRAIRASARLTLKAEGFRPNWGSGPVKYGPLKGIEVWKDIDEAFRTGTRGLHVSGVKSLRQFMIISNIRHRLRRWPKHEYVLVPF